MGNELVCVSIPCPIRIVLLGGLLDLTVTLPCLTIASTNELTPAQLAALLRLLTDLLGGLGGLGGITGTSAESEG